MLEQNKSKAQLIDELREIRQRVSELEASESTSSQAVQKLEENEKRYRLIAQQAEDIIWTTDMELRLTYVSPSFERALGYTAEEIMALTPEQFLTSESLAAGLKAFDDEVAAAQPQPDPNYARVLELEYRHKDGSTFWTEMKFSFFRDGAGLPTGVLGVGRDITERKRTADALNQRVRELQSFQATAIEITRPHDLSDLLHTIVERAASLLHAESGGMYLCDSERREARCVVSYNTPRDYTGVILKYGEGAAGLVAQSGEPLIVDDYRAWSGGAAIYSKEKPFERLVSAPMLWQGEVTGVIHVLRSEGDVPFTQTDLELLLLFAHHAAIAVANTRQLKNLQAELTERKRTEERLQTNARQMTLLNELTRTALESWDLNETFQMLADRLGELLEADGAYITGWDEVQQRAIPVAAYGPMRKEYTALHLDSNEITLTDSVLQAGHVLAVDDVLDTPYLSPRLATRFPARSILALPLIAGQKKLGAALIAFNQQHHFTAQEIAFGEQTSRQIALAVARLHTLQETERLAREKSLLYEAARDFSTGLATDGVLEAIARHMTSALAVAGCTISRYEHEQERVVTLLDYDNSPNFQPDSVGTPHRLADYPATRRVLEHNQPLLVHANDPNADPAERAMLEQYGYMSVMLLPLAVGDRTLGLVELSSRTGDVSFTREDIRLARSLASTAAVTLENARLHEEMQILAVTDSLTGLANRRAFDRAIESEIARATRYDHAVALLMLDIDSFKQYNDTCGHLAGDKRLQAFARLLQDNVRHPDLVARYGGEEFVVLLPFIEKAGALILAERLRFAAEKAYLFSSNPDGVPQNETGGELGGKSIPGFTVSIGVAAYPEDARTAEGLLRAADDAELDAKRRGKNHVCAAPVLL